MYMAFIAPGWRCNWSCKDESEIEESEEVLHGVEEEEIGISGRLSKSVSIVSLKDMEAFIYENKTKIEHLIVVSIHCRVKHCALSRLKSTQPHGLENNDLHKFSGMM